MAKYKRTIIGSVLKSKNEGEPAYIKINEDVKLAKGSTLKLESKKFQLESLAQAVEAGRLQGDLAEKIEERIQKIPDYVLFHIVQLEKNA